MSVRPPIATPCYGGMLAVNYVTSVLRLRQACAQLGVPVEFFFNQDSHIDRARNACVEAFLRTGCTHLLFIDADIGFEPRQAFRVLATDGVKAAVYPIKAEDAGFPIDPAAVGAADADGFAEANEAPTGFMCIDRRVFEAMAGPGWFDSMRVEGEFLTEDYAFCHRWRALGGKILVDVTSNLTHQGTKLYERDFGSVLAARQRKAA